jgi:hypothetical protein
MTVTLLAQFDGMMQLAHLIFQRPVMQWTQLITEGTKRTQVGSTMSIVPLSQSSHLWQTHSLILALGKP